MIWTNAVSSLQDLIKQTEHKSNQNNLIFDSGKKNKKRKNDTADLGSENPEKLNENKIFSELVLRSEYVLDSVKHSCTYDTEGFIDEVRTCTS